MGNSVIKIQILGLLRKQWRCRPLFQMSGQPTALGEKKKLLKGNEAIKFVLLFCLLCFRTGGLFHRTGLLVTFKKKKSFTYN